MLAAEDSLIRVWREHIATSLEAAKAILRRFYPAWISLLDGELYAMNAMGLWLWDAQISGRDFDTRPFRGANIFAILARNLYRVPAVENAEFFRVQYLIEHSIYGNHLESPLAEARRRNHEIQALYRIVDMDNLEGLWQYDLRIQSPEDMRPRLLAFRVTVSAIAMNGKPFGYVSVCKPTSDTYDIIKRKYKELLSLRGKGSPIKYLLDDGDDGSELSVKEHDINQVQGFSEDEQFWREYLGPFLRRTEVQQRLGLDSLGAVNELTAQHKLLAVPTQLGEQYPALQFLMEGQVDPTVARVIAVLGDVVTTPYTIAAWLKAEQEELNGETPLGWLSHGRDPERVIEVAKHTAADLDQ